MKKSIISIAALASLASGAAAVDSGRHILLEEGGGPPGRVRFFSQAVELAEGARQSWVTITRMGDFTDPRYGDFKITPTHLDQMVANFDKRTLGQDVFLDVAHRPSDGAAGKFLKLAVENGRLRGLVEWNEFGIDAVRKRGFQYLSAEYHENFKDNEKQLAHGCVLLGAGLTTRPVIKNLDPVQLSLDDGDHDAPARVAISPQLLKELSEQSTMKHLETLRIKLLAIGLSEQVVVKLLAEAKKQLEAAGNDDAKCLALVSAWEATGKAAHDEISKLAAGQPVTINLSAPAAPAGNVDEAVTRALAARDLAAEEARSALGAKQKLLGDTIAAGDKTLTPEGVKALADEVAPLITAVTTDDQVKHLAEMQLRMAQKLSAATKLVSLGYLPPSGSVHIAVDSSNEVKSLQSALDKRLGLTATEGDEKRFWGTGGKLLAVNKAFAEKVLGEFDQANGHRLHAEHKMLAGGTGTIADIKVPASVERTVLREALFNLVALNFMDVGTHPLVPSIPIPYSYRDTSAAGVGNARIYERQGIQRAGVVQTWDTAYPIPQKLAFNISNEMQYLLAASPINFDPIAENVANLVRIVGEDTEALSLNEIVRAADEYLVAAGNDTLTATVNGANKIFVTSQFPVVRPRTQYDLQGSVAVATVNPITVTLNGVARSEYIKPADGSALAAGLYWVMDYNLGEFRFVNESGVLQTPTNGWALVITYSYSTNASKFNIDLGAQTVGQRYDDLLTAIGARKVVIEDDRYYQANACLMSGGVNNALGQATTFTANGSRVGTSLNPDGSVGVTKGIGTFKVAAPGMMINDNRIVVCERGNSRFRMLKPWSMGPLQDARNANGMFIAAKEGYGEQYVAVHTPVNRKLAATSIVLYSAAGRVARAS